MRKQVKRKWIVCAGMVLIDPADYDLVESVAGQKFRIDPNIAIPNGFKKIAYRPLVKKYWSLQRFQPKGGKP